MNCDILKEHETKFTEEAIAALDELPVLARLQFVRHLLFRRYGNSHSTPIGGPTMPEDPTMVRAVDILDGIIDVMNTPHKPVQLRTPEP